MSADEGNKELNCSLVYAECTAMRLTNKCPSRSLAILRFTLPAQVVKLVDTLASGASARKGVEVQVLFWAPHLDRLVLQAPAHTKIAAPTASFPTSTKPVPDKRTPDGLFYTVTAA